MLCSIKFVNINIEFKLMRVDSASHLIVGVRYVPSPNVDDRPGECSPSLIVIHNISLPPNEFGGPYIEQLFTNQLNPDEHAYFKEIEGQKVSAHVLIRRDGSITQFVPFNRRAWHAGESCYEGQEKCNDFSIGIELEGADEIAYEDHQYQVLSTLIDSLRIAYPTIKKQHIVGHSDIAPHRKTDPGNTFDWERLKNNLS